MNEENQDVVLYHLQYNAAPWFRTLLGDSFQGREDGDGTVEVFEQSPYLFPDYQNTLY